MWAASKLDARLFQLRSTRLSATDLVWRSESKGTVQGCVRRGNNLQMLRRLVIKGISGVGKTTLSRELSERLGVPHVELDALHHGPNWESASPELLRSRVNAALDDELGWIVDGNYTSKLGSIVLERAQLIVWLDLPLRTALMRLTRRTASRLWSNEELWNGNRESLRGVFYGFDGLYAWTLRSHFRNRRAWPQAFGATPYVHLRSPEMVNQWLAEVAERAEGAAS